jgi:hypothetical protein
MRRDCDADLFGYEMRNLLTKPASLALTAIFSGKKPLRWRLKKQRPVLSDVPVELMR